jgi:hypothetical protein
LISRKHLTPATCDHRLPPLDSTFKSVPFLAFSCIYILKKVDKDLDGFIEPEELEAYLGRRGAMPGSDEHSLHALVMQLMKTLDLDHDGRISLAELRSLAI